MSAGRAPYAEDFARTRGRLHPEPESASRNPFRRDADRIIHSTAFRRLKHKTQVFVFHEGDHYRTRLTHTLEVTQIARALARALGLDEDLAEALALAHDLGHPPFGHAGERALDACLADFGGFDHNAQTLRIVTAIERRYPDFDGLNLSWETLEGIVKHNGPLTDADGKATAKYRENGVPQAIADYNAAHDLALWSHAGAEAQVAAIADDIAYDAHDLDDGLRADLFAISDLAGLPVLGGLLREVRDQYPGIDPARLTHELVRRLIGKLIEDVVGESVRRFGVTAPTSADEVRAAGEPMVAFSAADGVGRPRDQGIPLDQHVPPSAGDRRDGGRRGRGARAVRALLRVAAGHAARMGAGPRSRRRGGAGAPRRGFHRRNDRRLRAGRARAAVSEGLT